MSLLPEQPNPFRPENRPLFPDPNKKDETLARVGQELDLGVNYPPDFIKDTTKALPPSEFHRYGEEKARIEQLSDNEATAPKTEVKQPCGPSLILSGHELKDALGMCADDLDTRIGFIFREGFESTDGMEMPRGLYAYLEEYPEEGLMLLDSTELPPPVPPADIIKRIRATDGEATAEKQ